LEKRLKKERIMLLHKIPVRGLPLLDGIIANMEPDIRYTIEELAQFPDIPAELLPHLLRSRIASLITQGKLRRIVTNENTYYMLP
jgi:hypothetical protein